MAGRSSPASIAKPSRGRPAPRYKSPMPPTVPGPDPLPVATYKFARDPYTYFADCQRRFGPVFQSWLAGQRIVLSGEPEHVRTIFAADHDHVGAFNPGHLHALLGQHSLILIDGARHQRERKLLAPPAARRPHALVRPHHPRQRPARSAAWQPGVPMIMQDTTQGVSLDVIVRAVFGVQEPARGAALEANLLPHHGRRLAALDHDPLAATRPRPADPLASLRPRPRRRPTPDPRGDRGPPRRPRRRHPEPHARRPLRRRRAP
jgi:cytochrome P450